MSELTPKSATVVRRIVIEVETTYVDPQPSWVSSSHMIDMAECARRLWRGTPIEEAATTAILATLRIGSYGSHKVSVRESVVESGRVNYEAGSG